MERSTVLGCTAPCHLAQGGGVGGQLAPYFLLLLGVPSCSCSDRINKSGDIRTRNQPAANCRTLTASQVRNLATVDSSVAALYCGYWLFGIWLMKQCSSVYSFLHRLTFGTKTIILSLAFVFFIKITAVMLLECKKRKQASQRSY